MTLTNSQLGFTISLVLGVISLVVGYWPRKAKPYKCQLHYPGKNGWCPNCGSSTITMSEWK